MKIGLISSVPEEGGALASCLTKQTLLSGKPLFRGTIQRKRLAYLISGIGKTNAAHAATLLIEKARPDAVVLFGVAGAYPGSGLKVGDLVVAVEEIYGDEGLLLRDGFHPGDSIGIPLVKKGKREYFNLFPLDRHLVEKAVRSSRSIARLLLPPCIVKAGTFVTVSTCSGTRKRGFELGRRYHAICENMEGAAVAQICALYNVPMVEIRGISNIVEDRDRSKWDIGLAADHCQRAVLELLKIL